MEINFNTATFIDRHRKGLFVLPCLMTEKTNFRYRKSIAINLLWLIWGVGVEITWEKNK